MNGKRFIIGGFAVFVFIFAFDWMFHGVLMEEVYAQTPNLWRPKSDMMAFIPWLYVGQAMFAFVFSFIFLQGYQNKGIPEGFRYGFWIALLVIPGILSGFATLPYSGGLVAAWCMATLIEMGLAGAILAALYRKIV